VPIAWPNPRWRPGSGSPSRTPGWGCRCCNIGPYVLDMAYPGIRLGIEYDGREHLTPERALRDLRRAAYLAAAGWEVLRFPAAEVLRRPSSVAATVREKLILAARARRQPLAGFDPR
jgi:very-short-patch-repair endonuclease